jgi:inner membrane transporter RhtA
MNRDVGGLRPPVSRERAAAVGLVLPAAVSPQVGAAFAVTLFDELGPAGAAFLRLAFAAIVLWAIWRPRLAGDLRLAGASASRSG